MMYIYDINLVRSINSCDSRYRIQFLVRFDVNCFDVQFNILFSVNSLSDVSSYNIIICINVCVLETKHIATYIIWIKLKIMIGTARLK